MSRSVEVGDVDELARLITSVRAVERSLNAVLAEEGLRTDVWRIMHLLATRPGLLMGEISEALALPAANTTRCVDELVENGFAFRRPSPDDGRRIVVHLSRAGHERLKRTSSLISSRLAAVLESVPEPA
jgi:DNA-binding MarR family transcriptional regulator